MKRSTLHNMTYDSYDDMSTCWLECELSDWMPPYYKAINYSHTFVIQVTQIPNSIKKKLKFWPPVLLRDMIMKENMKTIFLRQCGLLCNYSLWWWCTPISSLSTIHALFLIMGTHHWFRNWNFDSLLFAYITGFWCS